MSFNEPFMIISSYYSIWFIQMKGVTYHVWSVSDLDNVLDLDAVVLRVQRLCAARVVLLQHGRLLDRHHLTTITHTHIIIIINVKRHKNTIHKGPHIPSLPH